MRRDHDSAHRPPEASRVAQDATRAVWGVGITMTGTLVQSCQYVYEEKVMSGDIQAPPWLLIGMEGVTGTLITIFILYPLAYWAPGDDHGSFENVFNTAWPSPSLPSL